VSERPADLTPEERDRRIDAQLVEHPGLAPRHAAMFVDLEVERAQREWDELQWERAKGRAFAEGAANGGLTHEGVRVVAEAADDLELLNHSLMEPGIAKVVRRLRDALPPTD
jgi:hypothetical protein